VIVAVTTDAEQPANRRALVSVADETCPRDGRRAGGARPHYRRHDLRRVISYHQRVASASQFAATFAGRWR